MPSPIAHVAAGYVLYQIFRNRTPRPGRLSGWAPPLLIATVGLSLLPDLDAVAGVVAGDMARFHNNLTHSVFAGLIAALVMGAIFSAKGGKNFTRAVGITLACYTLHIAMDYFTVGRGVMVAWPLSVERFSAPFKLFYGFHWSQGWISTRHLVTVATELPVAAGAALLARRLLSRNPSLEPVHASTGPTSADGAPHAGERSRR